MPSLTFSGPPGAVDELNVWAAPPAAQPREFSLEASDEWGIVEPLCALNCFEQELRPAGEDAEGMSGAWGRMTAAAAALPAAEKRVAAFVAIGGAAAPGLGPEQELASWVASSHTAASHGSWDRPREDQGPDAMARRLDFQQAAAQLSAFFEKVRDSVRSYATVVSRRQGVVMALTSVSWTGDFRTVWGSGLSRDDASKHVALIELALRTQNLWLRLAVTVIRSAFQLAALFAANPLLALPAAYRFASQVIKQVQELLALATPAQSA